jgi:hypothetical protein
MNLGRIFNARRTLAALVAVTALAVPGQAGAATAGKYGGTIGIGSGSEATNLSITSSGDEILVADSLGGVSAGTGCSKAKGQKVRCPATGITRMTVVLGGGGDTLDATAVPVPVSVWGGAGDDTLLMRNSASEWISCGDGSDSGTADAGDTVATDCETTLERPIGAVTGYAAPTAPEPEVPTGGDAGSTGGTDEEPTPDAGTDPPAEEPSPASPVAITAPATMPMSAQGAIAVGVRCTASEGVCSGSIELVEEAGQLKARAQVTSARRRKTTKKGTLLGRAKFSVGAGAAKRVQVQLSRRGRQRIIKKKKRKARAKLVITVVAPDGTVGVTEKNVTITAPKARRSASRRGAPKKPANGKGHRR